MRNAELLPLLAFETFCDLSVSSSEDSRQLSNIHRFMEPLIAHPVRHMPSQKLRENPGSGFTHHAQ